MSGAARARGTRRGWRAACVLAATLATPAQAQPFVEGFFGGSQSAEGHLTVTLDGRAPTVQRAQWDSESFRLPVYWAVRAGWDFGRFDVAAELVHHKLVLRSAEPPLEQFSISHGANPVVLSAAARLDGGVRARAGVGLVVAHPESRAGGVSVGHRDSAFDGYVAAGPVGLLAAGRRWALTPWWHLSLELAFTAAWLRVPVAGGHADLPDFAVHGRVGTAFTWPK